MKAELYKRLFKAIYTEDIVSLKKIAITIIQEESAALWPTRMWKNYERRKNCLEFRTAITES